MIIQATGMSQQNNITSLCNAIISGCVSVTACCNNIQLYDAAIIGFVACLIYNSTKKALFRSEIDDPIEIT